MLAVINILSLCLKTVNSNTLPLCVLLPLLPSLNLKINIAIKERKLGNDNTNYHIQFTLSTFF